MSHAPLLEIRDLHLSFDIYEGKSHVLKGVRLRVDPGEKVGLVGESGCGKSITARAVLGLLEQKNVMLSGEIRYRGANLFEGGRKTWRGLRGRKITMIFQDPNAALHPLLPIGEQMVAVILRGGRVRRREDALDTARAALRQVSIEDPERVLRSYPFQLSGGMNQRVMITMALASEPDLVLADEPGTSLDVTIQEQTLRLMTRLSQASDAAFLFIAHNLGAVREFCERVYVMYAGSVVEHGRTEDIFRDPLHPYTKALLAAVPRLSGGDPPKPIAGMVPDYTRAPQGCRFHPRCAMARGECRNPPPWIEIGQDRGVACVLYSGLKENERPNINVRPSATDTATSRDGLASSRSDAASPSLGDRATSPTEHEPLLALKGLTKTYMVGHSAVHALRAVDLVVRRGECLAVVGEFASGKTTLGKLVLGVDRPSAGEIIFAGAPVGMRRDSMLRRRIQLVQQNPMSALNPKRSIYASVSLPLAVHSLVPPSQRRERTAQLLELVGISQDYLDRLPSTMSGGQRQRVAIARALAAEPECLVLDEPTSSLDVSVQARVLELLMDLRKTFGLTFIFITHDLAVVRNIADRVAVLYRGRVVESGDNPDIFTYPRHRYTQMLLSSVPVISAEEMAHKPSWPWDRDIAAGEKVAEHGCAFALRCPYADAECRSQLPFFREVPKGHRYACVHPG